MPTQEERLTTLEFNLNQFKTETLKAYTDMAYELTIVKGLGENSIGRLAALHREMNEFRAETAQHFDEVHDRLNQMYDEINAHTFLLHQILDRLSPIKE